MKRTIFYSLERELTKEKDVCGNFIIFLDCAKRSFQPLAFTPIHSSIHPPTHPSGKARAVVNQHIHFQPVQIFDIVSNP
jgi:hypothetical protein